MSEPAAEAYGKKKSDAEIFTIGMRRTDIGNAERFAARYRGRARYCYGRKKWLLWDGKRWQWDSSGVVVRMGIAVVRSIYEEASRAQDPDDRAALAKHARASEKSSAVKSMLEFAQAQDGIPVALDDLDADSMLLNCENGTINLLTGELQEHKPSDLITKLCPAEYRPGATHPMFDRFMDTATQGDGELHAYIRRAAGYSIQGEASEKALFLVYGLPDTAKSTLIDAMASALGDYHMTAAASTWLVQDHKGGNRGDLVRLAGSRLVTTVEFQKGARFDEEIIKAVTGGDLITAAAKYEAEVTFRPRFALWLAANHAPAIHADDGGMWNRMRRIPFSHQIPKAERDPAVKEVIKTDPDCRAAVLAWAVKGCLEWQKVGLGSAQAVDASTKAYQDEMDPIGDFLRDELIFHPDNSATPKDIRKAYDMWAKEEGVRSPLGRKEFQKVIEDNGGKYTKSNGNRIVVGVRRKGEYEGEQ